MDTEGNMIHKLLSGETIEFTPPTSMVAAFVDRVLAMATDPTTTVVQLETLVYGSENPLLSTLIILGRAVVTRSTYEDPTFHVMLDLIGRKRAALGQLDLEAARARYTMTVREAARLLAVTDGAVRQAIHAGRLPSWKDGGTYYLDPVSVSAYRVVRRGPQPVVPPLDVVCGSKAGTSFSVKTPHPLTNVTSERSIVRGLAGQWKRIAVLASKGENARMFILDALMFAHGSSDDTNEVVLDNFFVRGKFVIVKTENNAKRARAAFKSFKAE
jgi:excisionase family DNA binding protein